MPDARVTFTDLGDGITADVVGVRVLLYAGTGVVQSIVEGANVTVDNTDPAHPIVSATGGGGGGGAVDSVNGQTGVVVLAAADVGADASGAAAAAQAAAVAASQPLDSDLTAIAALATTTFGRALLTLADAAALRTSAGLGTAAVAASTDFDAAGAAAAAQAASQPLDSDLTAIAALTTTSYGRAFLALADAAAGRTALGLGTAATSASTAFDASGAAAAAQAASQPLDSDLTAIAALTTTTYGRAFLALADAAAGRTALGLGTAATSASTDFQPIDSDLTAIAALTTTSFGRSFLALADAAAGRTLLGLGTLATQSGTFSGTSSGTNTGDQTVTLTGDVTGSGTGSFAATIKTSVALAGSPTTTTQAASDNSTKVATTAYVDTAALASGAGFGAAPNALTGSPTLAGWWKGDGITGLADGDPVVTWPDSSGNGRDLTQATSTKRPLWKATTFNGQACVRFDGVDDFLLKTSSGIASTGACTMVAVVHNAATTASNTELFMADFRGTQFVDLSLVTQGRTARFRSGGSATQITETEDVMGTAIWTGVYDGAVQTLYRDAMRKVYGATTGSMTASTLSVGCNDGNGTPAGFWTGDIAEVVFFTVALTAAQRIQLYRYLAHKYSTAGVG